MEQANKKAEDIEIGIVEETNFSKMLIHCIAQIQERTQEESMKKTGNIENMMKFLTNEEKIVDELYWLYRPILNCLKTIDDAIYFITNYNKRDFLRNKYIPFDEFCLYHYDVICHKVATLKDLYFKLINKLYGLNLKSINWKELKKQKQIISNERLFEILQENFRVSNMLEIQRHKSSHDGQIRLRLLNEFSIIQMQASLREMMPENKKKDLYSKESVMYYVQMNKAKEKVLDYLHIIKYNSIIITRELFIALTCRLCFVINGLFPNENFEVVD